MRVAVVGLGYVGLPQALLLARHHEVVGVDISCDRVDAINAGRAPFAEPGLQEALSEARECGFSASVEPVDADVFVICVPTPMDQQSIDTRALTAAARSIVPHLHEGALVIVESTVGVGTCHQVVAPILDGAGVGYHLAYCPERAMPGQTLREIRTNARIVGVDSCEAWGLACRLYESLGIHLHRATVRTAETVKLAENTFRAVNIALSNDLSDICEKNGVDVQDVVRLANLHPRVSYLQPGPGVGGHCLPLDPWFLIDGHRAPVIRRALAANAVRPRQLASRVKGSLVLVLGLAYKADVDDVRESPSEAFIEALEDRGLRVYNHDAVTREWPADWPEVDSVVFLVRHRQYVERYAEIIESAGPMDVYDFANVLPRDYVADNVTIHRLGAAS